MQCTNAAHLFLQPVLRLAHFLQLGPALLRFLLPRLLHLVRLAGLG